ncbi:TonB-dependent hemoglobin/transferrin/lactoferrin family receptor [Nodosilinea sp. LEGE 07298]|uniref:TonB-dependent hemoglobin/transferrin/lactoferrin family receptor n=1 Tax=Nodosilinea sp. LEGE 07298 TaxID=2777970 RepID=UPI0018825BFC|nr:TonB-dependent hemoglobin/transferrin/lactoferrin family receptor [Nodosilinea sp. LEGE 07298]MBE9111872.1 TonB-dependent hemoglobin/transferrin/lactoferrin family receptor [Nodosilinea sp. LEGE 07298]
MLKQFLLRIFLVCSTPLLLVLPWDVAHAASVDPNEGRESGELSHLADDDSSYQSPAQPLAEHEPVAAVEPGPTPPLLSEIEPLTTTSAALRPTPETQYPTPDTLAQTPETLAQTADDLPEVEFTSGGTLRITVTGTRTPRAVDALPATVTVFELEDFEFYQIQGLDDLLRYEPGVSAAGALQRYGTQDVTIRGIGGNRILFQLDGIRLPDQFSFGNAPPRGFRVGRGDYVDFATLQAVEVLRGPASTLYGSDALGGVISFRSLQPSDLLGPDDTVAGDVFSTYSSAVGGLESAARIALRNEDLESVFVLSRRDGRELSNFAPSRFTDSIDIGDTNLYGNVVYFPDEVSSLSLIFEDVNRRTAYGLAPGNVDPLALSSSGENQIDRTRLSLSYEFDDLDSESFLQFARGQIYYQVANTTEVVQEVRPTGTGPGFAGSPVRRNSNNQFITNTYGGEVQLRSDFATGNVDHRLTYGVDVSQTFNSRPRDRIQTNLVTGAVTNVFGTGADSIFPIKDFADADTLRLGLYLQDEIAIGPLNVIAGLRFDHYDLQTIDDGIFRGQTVDLTASALSPRLAVLYDVTPEISFYSQYARGFRAPLYSEITGSFTNLAGAFFKYETLSNPNLQPESSNSFEVGVRGTFPQWNARLTGFYNTYNNFIATEQQVGTRCLIAAAFCSPTQRVSQFQAINIGRARIYGVEFGGEYRFSPSPSGFSLLASLALAQGDDLSTNQPLNTVDPFSAVAGLRYQAPENQWRAELLGTFVGRARVPEGNTNFVPDAYALVDLIGAYNVTPALGINLGLYNLLNTEYYQYSEVRDRPNNEAISQFSQAGTNVRLGLNYRF